LYDTLVCIFRFRELRHGSTDVSDVVSPCAVLMMRPKGSRATFTSRLSEGVECWCTTTTCESFKLTSWSLPPVGIRGSFEDVSQNNRGPCWMSQISGLVYLTVSFPLDA
jgi:hypothetical protein